VTRGAPPALSRPRARVASGRVRMWMQFRRVVIHRAGGQHAAAPQARQASCAPIASRGQGSRIPRLVYAVHFIRDPQTRLCGPFH
jgi:hypothetical protein